MRVGIIFRAGVVLGLTTVASTGCHSLAAPASDPVTFTLRSISAQPLPAAVSNTAGGRLIEVLAGSLTFETLSGGGRVDGYLDLRITDPGVTPRVERRFRIGRAVRLGRTVEVTYATGARESFAVERGEATLRTTAASCAPSASCLDILREYRYERGHAPAGT
jgi:hypothetical protein